MSWSITSGYTKFIIDMTILGAMLILIILIITIYYSVICCCQKEQNQGQNLNQDQEIECEICEENKKYQKCTECTKCCNLSKFLSIFLQVLAICFYFAGDNIYYVVRRYGGYVGCNDNMCINIVYYVATALLGVATVLYLLASLWSDHSKKAKAKHSHDIQAADFLPMVAVIVQMDLMYTIVTSRLDGDDENQRQGAFYTSITFLGVGILLGTLFIINKAVLLLKKYIEVEERTSIPKNLNESVSTKYLICVKKNRSKWVTVILAAFLLTITLWLHTFGDNLEPLDYVPNLRCTFPKDDHKVDESERPCINNAIIRFSLGLVAILSFSAVVIPLLVIPAKCSHSCCKRKPNENYSLQENLIKTEEP